jgi:DNA-binding NarL/FixJ family response regulator
MPGMAAALPTISVLVAGSAARAHVGAALGGCADIQPTIAAVGDGLAAAAARLQPDVALLDDAPEAIRAVLAASPATNVLALATGIDRERIVAAVAAGAGGYLLAGDDPAGLAPALRAAVRGESPLAPRAARALISGHPLARRDARLPGMEKRVLGLLARGCTDDEIRELLALTPAELDDLLAVVTGALGVADRTQAALWAQRHGYDGADGDPAQEVGPFTRAPGRFRLPARPTGKRPIGRTHDVEGCEDHAGPVRSRRDGAGVRGRGVR